MVHGGPGTDPPGTQPENHLRSPRAGAARQLRPEPWAEFPGNGQKVRVTPLLMQQGALRIEIDRLGAEPLLVQVEPGASSTNTGGPCPRRSRARNARPADRQREAANTLAAAAWGDGTTVDEAEKRAEQAVPSATSTMARAWWRTAISARPTCRAAWYPTLGRCRRPRCSSSEQGRLGADHAHRARGRARHQERLGDVAPTDLYSQVKAAFPDGNVPQAWADQWNVAQAATGTHGGSVVELRRFR